MIAALNHSQWVQCFAKIDAGSVIAISDYALLRDSPPPNRLAMQRAQRPGLLRSAPTSARQCQHRSHFGFALGLTETERLSPCSTVAADVISTNLRSSPSEASAS